MMGSVEQLHLSLTAAPESVGIARRAVSELGEELGMESEALDGMRTAISEAASNVVRHAYPDGGGAFDVDALLDGGQLLVVIRDFGQGLGPRLADRDASMRLGLGLIATLSSHYEIFGHDQGGTEVRIRFQLAA